MPHAGAVLDSITLLNLGSETFEHAAELDGIVSYDERLAQAASLHGIPVLAPS